MMEKRLIRDLINSIKLICCSLGGQSEEMEKSKLTYFNKVQIKDEKSTREENYTILMIELVFQL